jgi:hypothetical protein
MADAEDDIPLFATSVPAGGLTAGMQAMAALIDEDEGTTAVSDEQSTRPAATSRKRKAVSLGTVQVHLALASCEQEAQRPRVGSNPSSSMLRGDAEHHDSTSKRRPG